MPLKLLLRQEEDGEDPQQQDSPAAPGEDATSAATDANGHGVSPTDASRRLAESSSSIRRYQLLRRTETGEAITRCNKLRSATCTHSRAC